MTSASPHQTKLVEDALSQRFVDDIELQSVSLETSLAFPNSPWWNPSLLRGGVYI
jgi:hypothetical protein